MLSRKRGAPDHRRTSIYNPEGKGRTREEQSSMNNAGEPHKMPTTMDAGSDPIAPAPKRKRASRPKVKTGCNNCKLRRVKCGEERPQCENCVRARRRCDGYPAHKRTGEAAIPIAPRPGSIASSSLSETPPSNTASIASRPLVSRKPRALIVRRVGEKNSHGTLVQSEKFFSPTTQRPGGFSFNAQEGQYFQVFRTHTASELSGFFDSEFWTRSVLQESHSEASIRHAVVALGALYKTLEKASESPPSSPSSNESIDTAPNHYQFALQQYVKAITRMRESLQNNEARSHRTVLISIVLFTCFQSFTGDHKSAIQQIQAGLSLLHERQEKSKSLLIYQKNDSVEEELVQMFTRLAIQAKSYDMAFHFPEPYIIRLSPLSRQSDPTSPSSPSSPSDEATSTASIEAHIPEIFSTSQQARQALDSLCERIIRFNELLSSHHHGPNNILPRSVQSYGNGFRMQLLQWHNAFQPLLEGRRRPGVSNTERAGINVLKMIHHMTSVLFLMGFSTSEMEFDNFTKQFKEIIELAKEVVVDEELSLAQSRCGDLTSCRHKHRLPRIVHSDEDPYSHIKASFALDLGIVPPLFVVATKCRNRKLRREAINLLTSSPRREGMWDSLLCGKAAQWIMEVEEEELGEWDGPFGRHALQSPAEGKRVMVKEILFDLQRREATLRCGTRGMREGDIDERAKETYVWW